MFNIKEKMINAETSSRRPWKQGVGGALWVSVCLVATYLAMSYDFKPGRLGPRRTGWPTDTDYSYSTALIRSPGKTSVVAFLHPRCVCTRATVKQLIRALEAYPGAELIAPVFTPLELKDQNAWEESEYVKTIRAAIPGAKVVFDRGGVQAWRFGAYTSGTILVYDAQGREIFRGGITDRRGGERENLGLQQLALALTGEAEANQADPTPVFGCPLVAPDELEQEGGSDATDSQATR